MPDSFPYELTIDLNTLNHLGIGLYSNIPAVVSEVVANSWDADATDVNIKIDKVKGTIEVIDNGVGMNKDDINDRYLKVGYPRRQSQPTVTNLGRHVMGRKGIGKLSLFSIADVIEVRSIKLDGSGKVESKNGFIMDANSIQKVIKTGKGPYKPTPLTQSQIGIKKGTKIILKSLRKGVRKTTEKFLRTRIARRFSVISAEANFNVKVNGKAINIKDRDYFKAIQYLWHIGEGSEKYVKYCVNCEKNEKLDGVIDKERGYKISGWVGTVDEQKNIEEGNNTIVILSWGKLIHEDILKDIKEGGVFTKYLIGEIRADFLDNDDEEDMATSDRQSLKENDPRFELIKTYIQDKILKLIQSKWRDWRNEGAEKKAIENPKVKEWFSQLSSDNKKYARILFGKIEAFPISDPVYKKELYKHGILAFETLALKDNLSALDNIQGDGDLKLIKSIFAGIDELEAVHYYQIVKGRIEVLKKFERILPDAKEKLIQEHIFDHLWLLDPSWERASTDERMEESVMKEFHKVDAGLTEEEKKGRIDIRYRTAAGKHIIIELKKYKRKVSATELIDQVRKYRSALHKCLKTKFHESQILIESICIIGSSPQPEDEEAENVDMLRSVNARYITYDELIQRTRDSYRDYIDKQKDISRIRGLIDSL